MFYFLLMTYKPALHIIHLYIYICKPSLTRHSPPTQLDKYMNLYG